MIGYISPSRAFCRCMTETSTRLPDAVLLARCRREPAAFGIVYERHADALLRLVISWCRDKDVAIEIVQETFARALRDAHRFRHRGDGSAFPWLRTVARNLVYDWRRRGAVDDRVRCQLGIRDVRSDSTSDADERLDAARARQISRRRSRCFPPPNEGRSRPRFCSPQATTRSRALTA
jgi:DNA-directed RNA polymerase specialized sigma24 family protein